MTTQTEISGDYIVTTLSNGAVIRELNRPAPAPEPDLSRAWHITKDKFNARLTGAEKVGLEMASLDNPSADTNVRQLSASLRVAKMEKSEATYIDLTPDSDARARVAAGLNLGKLAGVLTDARIAEILDTQPTTEELYQG